MPYFIFRVKTAKGAMMDQDGSWFPDARTARREALVAARELVADCIKGGLASHLPEAIVISELSGKEVGIVYFRDALPRSLRPRMKDSKRGRA